jgi:DNA-directed RNA polymerase delta subunit
MSQSKSLYEQDFNLWCEDTAEKIRTADYTQIDWENLLQEVTGLAGRDRRELESRLVTLYEHLLKRYYLDLSNNYRGWEITILRTKLAIKRILKDSPSLNKYFYEIADDCFQEASKIVVKEYGLGSFPKNNPFSTDINQLLGDKDGNVTN